MTNHSDKYAKIPLASNDRGAISVGNAAMTGPGHRGWFVGPFLPKEAGSRRTDDLELKWGVHEAGETRACINDDGGMRSLAILVTGTFVIEFPALDEEVLLSCAGDYVLYGPDLAHGWRAIDASTVLTVRWSALEP